MKPEEAKLIQLTRGAADIIHPFWGVDGHIYFSSNAGHGQLHTISTDGKEGNRKLNEYGYWDKCDIWRIKPAASVLE